MEEKLLDFDRDVKALAKRVDWIEGEEAREKFVINFCVGKAKS